MSEPASSDVQLLFVTRQTSGVGRRMESVVASLQSRNRDRVAIRKVDADAEAELVTRLGIHEIPSVVFVHRKRLVTCLEGRATLQELEQVLTHCT